MNVEEIQCPACGRLLPSDCCAGCGVSFQRDDALNGHLLDHVASAQREAQAAEVEAFYSVSPFPGYAPEDNSASLLDRSRRSGFLQALDQALPHDGHVVDIGCGTGQTAMFLSLAAPRRRVLGVDGCRVSLELAEGFRRREEVRNLHLLRADLFDLPLPKQAFPSVICRGVVHHTPDPSRAISKVADLVTPGGTLVLGFYETWARAFHRARRGLSKVAGGPIRALDPILRQRDLSDEKKRIWIDDQYVHPLEKILPLPWVVSELKSCGLSVERAIPPMPSTGAFFERDATTLGLRTRAGWAAAGIKDPDAGLVCVVAKRA
jgi:SAM-dependent methyltransferase